MGRLRSKATLTYSVVDSPILAMHMTLALTVCSGSRCSGFMTFDPDDLCCSPVEDSWEGYWEGGEGCEVVRVRGEC